jgi:hypothetical protein
VPLLLPYVLYLVALAICGTAIWKGDAPLRWSAGAFIIGWMLTPAVSNLSRGDWDMPVAVIDTNVALLVVWVSLRWRRLWAAVLGALMLLPVMARIIAVVDPDVRRYGFLAANNVLVLCQMAVLIVAVWVTLRDRRRANEEVWS